MSKTLKQFYIEKHQVQELERRAQQQGVSQAKIVRDALDEYFK